MARLSDEERKAFLERVGERPWLTDSAKACRIVEPTPEARLAYIRFATTASLFFRGPQEIGFKGDNWKL